jgi:predicted DNA-binding transcriptional regulator AlpA
VLQADRALLGELLGNPARVAELAPGEAAGLLVELSALSAMLAVRARDERSATARRRAPDPEELLTPEEVAQRLQKSLRWVYRSAGRWPFTRRLGRKTLRFSRAGFEAYLRTLRP